MSRAAADLLALKLECQLDPKTLGLTTLPADDEANANALNLVRTILPIDRESISAAEIAKAFDRDEYNACSAADRDYLKMITASGSVNPKTGGEVREALLQIFGAGTETRASLTALLTESGNRIEQMFKTGLLQQGGTVTPSDISNARAAV